VARQRCNGPGRRGRGVAVASIDRLALGARAVFGDVVLPGGLDAVRRVGAPGAAVLGADTTGDGRRGGAARYALGHRTDARYPGVLDAAESGGLRPSSGP